MRAWCVLVELHNLVNIPPSACDKPDRRFTVEVKQVNTGTSGLPSQHNPTSTFLTSDVTESTPTVFEIRLDEPRRGGASSECARTWRCEKDVVDVVVQVREGDRLVGSSTTFPINVKRIVEDVKLATRIVGTEMGQVGVSFSVDPADRTGYEERLKSFMRRHNPRSLHLVQNVVDVVPEVDTFTKLYRKYRVRDYDKRLREFFAMYGQEYVQDIPALVKQWENREEELMRNLILDNGPELCDVDVHQRLTAFLAQYRLQRSDPNVVQIISTHHGDSAAMFAALTDRYGPEPDPRNYLFPATHYEPAPSSVLSSPHRGAAGESPQRLRNGLKASPTPLRPPLNPGFAVARATPHITGDRNALSGSRSRPYLSLLGASSSSSPDRTRTRSSAETVPVAESVLKGVHQASDAIPHQGSDNTSTSPRNVGFYGDVVFNDGDVEGRGEEGTVDRAQSQQRPPHHVTNNPAEELKRAVAGGPSSLWLRMKTMLRTAGQTHALQPEFFYYCSEVAFRNLADSLDAFSSGERESLTEEWRRMCQSSMEEVQMDQTSPGFDSALAEAADAAELHPVQFQVASMTSFMHREQYKFFNARLASAKETKTERLILVGDFRSLLEVARHGVGSSVSRRGKGGEAGVEPAAVFPRNPFARWKKPKSTCLLVCDVVVGRCYRNTPLDRLPRNGTKAFLEQYDSSIFSATADTSVSALGATERGDLHLAVYEPQQVLPHLLVHCTVDPLSFPCPSHPSRAVEYYVLNENAAACSRCVVMGRYRGLEVLPIEEAATQARGKLAEMQRAVNSLSEAMTSFSKQLREEQAMMPSAPRRVEAQREVDRIRREADERIAKIVSVVEQQDKAQHERIRADQQETEAIQSAAADLSKALGESQAVASPMAVMQALQQAKHDRAIEVLLSRVEERLPNAPLEHVHHPLRHTHEDNSDIREGHPTRGIKRIEGSTARRSVNASSSNRLPFDAASNSTQSNHLSLHHDGDFVATPPKLPAARSRGRHAAANSAALPTTGEDIYSTYQSLSLGIEAEEMLHERRLPIPHTQRLRGPREQQPRNALAVADHAARGESQQATESAQTRPTARNPKEALTKGWALLHNGDEAGAAAEWRKVRDAYGEDDVPGAKARAYLAEAIDKDYEVAAEWYAHCLELNPGDRLTAYNYGVLLEALLKRPHDAIVLYERAAALGDGVAAARAEQLRAMHPGTQPTST